MLLTDFDYNLPAHLIAQTPCERREHSRLLVVPRQSEEFEHHKFFDIVDFLRPGDVLVINNTKVIPARLYGKKDSGGKVEILLDRPEGDQNHSRYEHNFRCLVRASKPFREGQKVFLPAGGLAISKGPTKDTKACLVSLELPQSLEEYLDAHGQVPLPAYIKRPVENGKIKQLYRTRYQTVYAQEAGAVAAPTAGLHFSKELLDKISSMQVEVCPVTLHVGPGTFLPVRCDKIEEHNMHEERFSVSKSTAEKINRAIKENRRVVAVGTTVVRTLESSVTDGVIVPQTSQTNLFVYPGYGFQVVSALLTNFHLPQSTLLMLVAAFIGKERVLLAYQEAISKGYRFYSYGDAMFLC